jgi:hypothetical protein
MEASDHTKPLGEVLAFWLLTGYVTVVVAVTYARLAPKELYHVSKDGLAGGLGRALVVLNYPVALATIGVLAIIADRLGRVARVWAALAALLCAVTIVPGVVDQDDLDAKVVNALPAGGVALALALTAAALRRSSPRPAPPQRLDRIRLVIAAVLLVGGLAWIAADLGFYAGRPFLAQEVPPGETIAAVHLGHHHGFDGVYFALAALALSRLLTYMREPRLRSATHVFLALMIVYGVANAVQDFWLEQFVKRGWLDWEIPSLIVPEASVGWALIVVAAAALSALTRRQAAG